MNRMMMALVLALAACGSAGEQSASAPAQEAVGRADTAGLVPTAPLAALPPLALRPFHDAEEILDSVQVMRGARLVQTLIANPDGEPPPEGGTDVDTVDINLDGNPDVQQQIAWGATGNAVYTFWLFDVDSARFREAPEFGEKIQGYWIDPAKREITVRSNGGHAGAIFDVDVYQPHGRTLVRLRSIHQEWKPEIERYLRTSGSLDAGRWVERVDTFTMENLPPPDSVGT
jgi:hypothetical protein